jgi:hypothetical protein
MDPKILRHLFALAVWILVAWLILPLARRKGVSGLAWYFGALGAFYGPFLAITYGPIFVSLALENSKERSLFRAVMDHLPFFAVAGLAAGSTCLFLVRRKLSRLPESSAR